MNEYRIIVIHPVKNKHVVQHTHTHTIVQHSGQIITHINFNNHSFRKHTKTYHAVSQKFITQYHKNLSLSITKIYHLVSQISREFITHNFTKNHNNLSQHFNTHSCSTLIVSQISRKIITHKFTKNHNNLSQHFNNHSFRKLTKIYHLVPQSSQKFITHNFTKNHSNFFTPFQHSVLENSQKFITHNFTKKNHSNFSQHFNT